tara:strand:- start:22767 stop:23789 length:1023 start_codon:yes stop_codon:yes gene_type:complete
VKLLIVGNDTQWAIERFYCNHLNSLGITTSIYDVNRYYKLNSYLFKIRFKFLDASIFKKLNKDLISFCKQTKFKFVWIFKGIEIFPKTLQTLKKLGIILINYNPDHPFIRYSPSHGGSNIPKSIPLYDIIFSYRTDLVKSIRSKFNVKTCLLPFGYEKNNIDFKETSSQKKINRVCFLGTADEKRSKKIKYIAKNGFKVDVYSETFYNKRLLRDKNIRIFSDVYGQNFWNILYSYDIQLNFLRDHNKNSHNMRTFEVPGVGGVLLTEYSNEQLEFFNQDKEIFTFKNDIELLDNLEKIKSFTEYKKNIVRESARNRSLKSKYSYFDRSKIVLNFLKDYVK